MAKDRNLLSTAIRPTVITIIAYAVVKCVYYAVFYGEHLLPRAIASAALAALTLVFLIPNLSRRQMSWIVPTGAVLIELLAVPFVGYDRVIYFCLIGCTLLSVLFLDLVGLLITVGVSWAAVSVYLFVLDRSLVRGTVMQDDVFYFAGVVIVDIMIILLCKFYAGALEKKLRGTEAAHELELPLPETHSMPTITAPKFRAPEAKILVTDDIRTNLEVAKGLLSLYEIQVETCQSGAEAIEAIMNSPYDLIFMDHMMPEMDGVETTKRIRDIGRDDSRFKRLPIIALTANTVVGERETFLQNGFDDFLSKPIDTEKLAAILEKWIPNDKKISTGENACIQNKFDSDGIVIDGVDVKLGIARTGGTLSGYLRTLEIFCGDGREKIDEIKKSMLEDDMLLYTTYIHALKSAAANIGAVRLSEAAKVLEAAGKRGDKAFINKHTARVMADLVLVLKSADKVIAARMENTQVKTDKDALNDVLAKLKTAIDNVEPANINAAVRELGHFESAIEEDIRGAVKNISQNILCGDYDAATAEIDSLFTLTANTPQ